ncbi:MAG: adenylosuccinate lyase, partial [Phycisphaerae bacterium]
MLSANRPQDTYDRYETPLVTRNASEPMIRLFSARHRIITWRRLWLALAEAQKQLGLDITDAQIAALKKHLEDVDFDKAAEYERRFRHDVMAHIHTYGEAAPQARGILHLGATSAFVTDNADLII